MSEMLSLTVSAMEQLQVDDIQHIPDETCELLASLINSSFAPERSVGHERPVQRADFDRFIAELEDNLRQIYYILELTLRIPHRHQGQCNLKKSHITSLLVLCGENIQTRDWNTENCSQCVQKILKLICTLCKCNTIGEVLVKKNLESEEYFKPCLLMLRPKLMKNTWKAHPAAVASFCWMLELVKSPHLSDQLNSVLPTALILIDDYVPENRLRGIKCLHHIIENVPRTQLCWFGQAEVAYQALHPLLYQREEFVDSLYACLTSLLEKLEAGPDTNESKLEWSHYDEVFQILLSQMELEQTIHLRQSYVQALLPLMKARGIVLARWSRRILGVLQYYLETVPFLDPQSAEYALEALEIYMMTCQDCVPAHANQLTIMLLRFLYDVSSSSVIRDNGSVLQSKIYAKGMYCLRSMLRKFPNFTHDLEGKMSEMSSTSLDLHKIFQEALS